MSLINHNGKEVSGYIITLDDNFFSNLGYNGIPLGIRRHIKRFISEKKYEIVPNKKFMLGDEEIEIGEDEYIRTFFSEGGYRNATGIDFYGAKYYAEDIRWNWKSSITSMQSKYSGDTDLVIFPKVDTRNVTDMSWCFNSCSNLLSIPELNTSKVTNMSCCFKDCSDLQSIPLLDTRNVTNMNSCFSGCLDLAAIPQLDTRNVTNMGGCFYNCRYALTTIPQLDTSKVTNMSSCFYHCTDLTTIPLLDTSKVTDMSGCFKYCENLTTIPQLDTSKVTDMSECFYGCLRLRTIPELDTSNVTDMYRCFEASIRRIEGISFKSMGSISSSDFPIGSTGRCTYLLIKDIGTNSACTSIDFTNAYNWGVYGEHYDDYYDYNPDARQSLIDSLLTYSFDRKSAGYSNCTIKLHSNVKALLTEEEINQIQAKGYKIS